MEPLSCPMCNRRTIERVLDNVLISAKVNAETSVGGMMAYHCTENGHIFFVRTKDVEEELSSPPFR